MRAFAGGPAQVGELVRVRAVVQALVGRRRREAEDVFAIQRSPMQSEILFSLRDGLMT